MTRPQQQPDVRIDARWIAAHVGDPKVRIVEVDVSPATYDQGHIPGAVGVPIDSLREDTGVPRSSEELRRTFVDAGVTRDESVITSCTIGNRANEAWLALKCELDYPSARV